MVLSWFRAGAKTEDVNALIARKDYRGAIGALLAQLQKDPQNVFVRQQLADAYIAAGVKGQAITILEKLADDFARDGFAAKSISVLKRIQRLDPQRESTDRRLAEMIHAKELEDEKRMLRSRPKRLESIDDFVPPPASRPGAAPSRRITQEEIDEAVAAQQRAKPQSYLDRVSAQAMRDEDVEIEFEVPDIPPTPETQEDEEPQAPHGLTTPLFESFSREELVSVIQSFDLRSFEPGDIIVSEGEEGDSLFILTAGVVKAFVKNPKGQPRKVREMTDGDFFGEISFLKGGPRTATITAATNCDLLELSRTAVEQLVAKHPNIRETLEEFSNLRAGSQAESDARSE